MEEIDMAMMSKDEFEKLMDDMQNEIDRNIEDTFETIKRIDIIINRLIY